jgi:peptide/nickel transport system substrate-binding protein
MIAKYWSEVGIDLQIKVEPYPLYLASVRTNQHDAVARSGGATLFYDVLLNPSDYLPSSEETYWAVTWAQWFNRVPGYENQLPDPTARKSFEMYDRIRSVREPQEQIRLMKGALIVSRESFWTIGIAQGPQPYGIRRATFRNVPASMPSAWLFPDPAPTNPEQYFVAAP